MLQEWLHAREEHAYCALRSVSGLLFAFHGVQKVFGVFGTSSPSVGSQIWFGGWIELLTGVALGVGLFTTGAAFVASGTMAVAYTQFHWKLDLGERFLPALNRGELALVYAFVFLFIATRGDGSWSLARLLRRSR